MRIISGNYNGRRLESLAGADTRPTTNKVRESIFNMVRPYFDGETVLDLFAGSGGLTIEAVSRGCSRAVCIGKNYRALKIIKENIEITKEPEKFTTVKLDAGKVTERLAAEEQQFNYLFLYPPCAKQKIIDQVHKMEELGLFSKTAVVICGTDKVVGSPETMAGSYQIREQIYGITVVTIYRKERGQ